MSLNVNLFTGNIKIFYVIVETLLHMVKRTDLSNNKFNVEIIKETLRQTI